MSCWCLSSKAPSQKAHPQAWAPRRGPPRTRQPLPMVALTAKMGYFLVKKKVSMAHALMIGFSAYLRPRELSCLLVGQLLRPSCGNISPHSFWSLILHPHDLLTRSKAGYFDEGMKFDSEFMMWAPPFLMALTQNQSPLERSWPFTHQQLLNDLRRQHGRLA